MRRIYVRARADEAPGSGDSRGNSIRYRYAEGRREKTRRLQGSSDRPQPHLLRRKLLPSRILRAAVWDFQCRPSWEELPSAMLLIAAHIGLEAVLPIVTDRTEEHQKAINHNNSNQQAKRDPVKQLGSFRSGLRTGHIVRPQLAVDLGGKDQCNDGQNQGNKTNAASETTTHQRNDRLNDGMHKIIGNTGNGWRRSAGCNWRSRHSGGWSWWRGGRGERRRGERGEGVVAVCATRCCG